MRVRPGVVALDGRWLSRVFFQRRGSYKDVIAPERQGAILHSTYRPEPHDVIRIAAVIRNVQASPLGPRAAALLA